MKALPPILRAIVLAIVFPMAATGEIDVYTGQPVEAGNTYLLAGWNFNKPAGLESQLATSHGTGSLTANWLPETMTDFSGTSTNAFATDPPGRDLAVRNGPELANEGNHLTFAVSLAGFQNLVVTYAARRSSSGFTDHEWWWSVGDSPYSHLVTIQPESSYEIYTIDFTSVAEIHDADLVKLRLVLRGVPTNPSSTGNNRIDNVQFRATATAGTAGPGEVILTNATTGSPLRDTSVFSPGELQDLRMELTVPAGSSDSISSVLIQLPDGWTGLARDRISLDGSGFETAAASVAGRSLTISGATVSSDASGKILLKGIIAPASAHLDGWGRSVAAVETAAAGEELSRIAKPPELWMPVPIAALRAVDALGIPLALGKTVAVIGVAAVPVGTLSVTTFLTWIQDDSAAVPVTHYPITAIWKIAEPGRRYLAIGTLTQINGATEIAIDGNDGWIDLGPAEILEPPIHSIADLLANAEALEGRLIRIVRAEKSPASPPWPDPGVNGTILVTDGSGGELDVYLNRFTDVALYPEPEYPADLVGIFTQFASGGPPYDSGYQLMPRSRDDILPPTEVVSGYDRWRAETFAPSAASDPAISGADADPDFDGLSNLLEYALGADPLTPSPDAAPRLTWSASGVTFTFWRVGSAIDLLYAVERSSDLSEWQEIWTSVDAPYSSADPIAEETITAESESISNSPRFYRLKIFRLEPDRNRNSRFK